MGRLLQLSIFVAQLALSHSFAHSNLRTPASELLAFPQPLRSSSPGCQLSSGSCQLRSLGVLRGGGAGGKEKKKDKGKKRAWIGKGSQPLPKDVVKRIRGRLEKRKQERQQQRKAQEEEPVTANRQDLLEFVNSFNKAKLKRKQFHKEREKEKEKKKLQALKKERDRLRFQREREEAKEREEQKQRQLSMMDIDDPLLKTDFKVNHTVDQDKVFEHGGGHSTVVMIEEMELDPREIKKEMLAALPELPTG